MGYQLSLDKVTIYLFKKKRMKIFRRKPTFARKTSLKVLRTVYIHEMVLLIKNTYNNQVPAYVSIQTMHLHLAAAQTVEQSQRKHCRSRNRLLTFDHEN